MKVKKRYNKYKLFRKIRRVGSSSWIVGSGMHECSGDWI